ncbi:hypothetical protein ACIHCQ_32545 [Streptomyces sp. NPDC052236]|uniref:RraA family protein n=1 Tax=Streptomyces sp. NPDC052236 TaxID=3365686 RepID=UPI0037CE887E
MTVGWCSGDMSNSSLLERFAAVDSAAVSDALDQLGLPAGVGGIGPVWGPASVVGFAVAVGLEPRADGPAGAHIATTAIEASDSQSMIVIDNQGRADVSCWDGILSLGAAQRGARGVVADETGLVVVPLREPRHGWRHHGPHARSHRRGHRRRRGAPRGRRRPDPRPRPRPGGPRERADAAAAGGPQHTRSVRLRRRRSRSRPESHRQPPARHSR